MRHSLHSEHTASSDRFRLRRYASVLGCVLLALPLLFRPGAAAGDPPPEAAPPLPAESAAAPDKAPAPVLPAPAPATPAPAGPLKPPAPTAPLQTPVLPDASLRPVGPLPVELEYLADPAGRLRPEDLAAPAQQNAFTLLHPGALPRKAGVFWFRFRPDSAAGTSGGRWVLDLNSRVPGMLPSGSEVFLAPTEHAVPARAEAVFPGIRLLPEAALNGTVYIRSAGSPGLAFAPVLRERTALTVADGDAVLWMRGLLGLCLLLTVIRAFAERREWRMWAGLFTGAVLVRMIWGLPGVEAGLIRLVDLPGLLAPGVALFILPHAARRLLRTGTRLPAADMLLILTGLLGLACCLIPLIPGYAWTVRFLPLWPMLMLLPVPMVVYAAFRKIPGARRFLLVCLLPPLSLAALSPEGHARLAALPVMGSAANLPGLLPDIGLCLAAMLFAVLPTPGRREEKGNVRRPRPSLPAPVSAVPLVPAEPAPDPARIVVPHPAEDRLPSRFHAADSGAVRLDLLEQRLRGPLDTLLNELGMLDRFALSHEARRHLENLSGAGRKLARLIGDLPAQARPEAPGAAPEPAAFDLHQALLTVHDAVLDRAEERNISLSWYAAPHLARWYEGDRDALIRTLSLLTESAVRATERGTVRLSVQRVPESNDPGLLRFSIADTGTGTPPLRRNPLALIRAWETAASEGGSVSLHSGPSGTEASFSVRLQVIQNDGLSSVPPEPAVPLRRRETGFSALRILVVSDVPMTRQMLAHYLDELPHEVHEARSAAEALAMYTASPGALLVFDVDLGVEDIADGVAGIRAVEGERDYPLASILVLVDTEEQGELLRRSGCTHVLYKPFSRTGLRRLALRLAPLPRRHGTPAPVRPAFSAADTGAAPAGAPMRLDMPGTPPASPPSTDSGRVPGKSGRASAPRPAPRRSFSNVGEPMPIPRSAQDNVPGKTAEASDSALKRKRAEQPAPVRIVPAPGTAAAPADAVEWVGEPMPVAKTAPGVPAEPVLAADRAVSAARADATSVPEPSAACTGTVPAAPLPNAAAAPEPAPAAAAESPSPAAQETAPPTDGTSEGREIREEPEVRVIRRPLRTPGAGGRTPDSAKRNDADPSPRKPGLLRSLFTAVGLNRSRPAEPPTVPALDDDRTSAEWVGEPMPVTGSAPAEPAGSAPAASPDAPPPAVAEEAAPASAVPAEPQPEPLLPAGKTPAENDKAPADAEEPACSGVAAAPETPEGTGPEAPVTLQNPEPLFMPGLRGVNRPLSLLNMMLPDEEEIPEPRPAAPDRLVLPGTESEASSILTLTERTPAPEPPDAARTETVAEVPNDDGTKDELFLLLPAADEEAVSDNAPAQQVPESPAAAEAEASDRMPPQGTADHVVHGPKRREDVHTEPTPPGVTKTPETENDENDEEARYAALPTRLIRAYEAVRQGNEAGDLAAVCRAAGELAELAQDAGLREVAEPARYLEEAARDRDTDAVDGLLSDIRKAVERNTQPL